MCFTGQSHFGGLEIQSAVYVVRVAGVTALVPSSSELPSELEADLVQT